ncbi:hypothetical protein MRX96_000509 [Rhipicephalus microplus]
MAESCRPRKPYSASHSAQTFHVVELRAESRRQTFWDADATSRHHTEARLFRDWRPGAHRQRTPSGRFFGTMLDFRGNRLRDDRAFL